MEQEDSISPASVKMKSARVYRGVVWWAILITAVLAVPALAIIATTVVNANGINEVVVFVLACWLCIFLGLNLVKNPRIAPMLFERVGLSSAVNQRCLDMAGMIEEEMEQWYKRYDKCEAAFMNTNREPAWSFLEEAVQILGRLRQSIADDGSVALPDIRALHQWVHSSKPAAVEAYLDTLKSAYAYARASLREEKGRNIDEAFPELGNGHIESFLSAPNHAKNFAHELLNTIRNEQPMLAMRLEGKAKS